MKKLCKFNDDIYIGTTRAIASKLKDEGYEIINSLTGEVFVTDDNEIKHSFNLDHDFGKKFTEYRFGSNLEIYKNMLFCYKIGLDFHNEFSIGIFEPRKTLNNKINRDLIIKSLGFKVFNNKTNEIYFEDNELASELEQEEKCMIEAQEDFLSSKEEKEGTVFVGTYVLCDGVTIFKNGDRKTFEGVYFKDISVEICGKYTKDNESKIYEFKCEGTILD